MKPGDRVTLELDEGNEIADIHKEAQVAEGNQSGAEDGKGLFSGETPLDYRNTGIF